MAALNWSIHSDCGHVNYIDDPQNQCNFTRTVLDCIDKDGFVNYKQLTYCTFQSESYCSIMLLFILMIMFFTIGTNADDFLCPLLVTISKSLKLSDNIAGVTFLAFGNGAPDIFSSIVGIKDSSPNLIIGQLYGAGIFVTTVVVGSILLQNSFKIMKRPLLRDMIFYLITTTLVWWTFFNEKIRFYNSIKFIVTYLIYVTVVIVSGYIYKRQKSKLVDAKHGAQAHTKSRTKMPRDYLNRQSKYVVNQEAIDGSHPVSNSNDDYEEGVVLRRIKYRKHYQDPILQRRLTIYHICSDQLQQKHCIENQGGDQPEKVDSIATIQTDHQKNGINHQNPEKDNHEDFNNNNQLDHPGKSADQSSKSCMSSKLHAPNGQDQRRCTISDPSFDELTNKTTTDHVVGTKFKSIAINLCSAKRRYDQNPLMVKLIAASRFDRKLFDELNVLGKFTMIVKAPIYLILTLTIPVVDNDLPMRGWIRNLNLAHLIISPQICLFIIRTNLNLGGQDKSMAATYQLHSIVLLVSAVLFLLVYFTSQHNHPPKYHILFAYFGFLVSISWIYVIANEVVNILDAVRVIFNLSKFMIGLTIGAWGNSIGDFLSNASMAKNGFPRMAISACFGGPVLNMLLGIGIPYTILFLRQQTKEISIVYNNMITVLYGTIALSLLTTMFTLLFTKFQSNKIHGYVLYAIYVCFILAAIITELGML